MQRTPCALQPTAKPVEPGPFLFSTDLGKTPISGFSYAKRTIIRGIATAIESRSAQPNGARPPFREQWQFHDLRRTVATIFEDDLDIARPVISAVLNHAESGATSIYTKGRLRAQKLAAMQALGRYLVEISGGVKPAFRNPESPKAMAQQGNQQSALAELVRREFIPG